jgi:hypothetical protein
MNSSLQIGAVIERLISTYPFSYLAGIGDIDGNGTSELVWYSPVWGNVTFQNMGGDTVTDFVGRDWRVVAVGDFNVDAKADVMFRNETLGINAAWLMNGTTIQNTVFYPGVPNDWHVVGAGDFDGNGTSDLLWHRDDGANAVWLMDHSAGVQQAKFLDGVGLDWHVVGTGDVNGDHKDDVVWRNDNGATGIWFMNGPDQLTASFPGAASTDWATQAHHYEFV